jgi:hypothetical protein
VHARRRLAKVLEQQSLEIAEGLGEAEGAEVSRIWTDFESRDGRVVGSNLWAYRLARLGILALAELDNDGAEGRAGPRQVLTGPRDAGELVPLEKDVLNPQQLIGVQTFQDSNGVGAVAQVYHGGAEVNPVDAGALCSPPGPADGLDIHLFQNLSGLSRGQADEVGGRSHAVQGEAGWTTRGMVIFSAAVAGCNPDCPPGQGLDPNLATQLRGQGGKVDECFFHATILSRRITE